MKSFLLFKPYLIVISLTLCGCSSPDQEIQVLKFPDLQNIIEQEKSEVLIVNFWATFCKPCLKEIPIFEEINKRKNVKVLLVSMDFASQKAIVDNYVSSEGLQSEVVLLNEPDYDSWIPKIDSAWSGALPATLIISTTKKKTVFKEGIYNEKDLLKALNGF